MKIFVSAPPVTPTAAAPTGLVTIRTAAQTFGSIRLELTNFLTLPVDLPVGQTELFADYAGDDNYTAVTSAVLPLTVTKGIRLLCISG